MRLIDADKIINDLEAMRTQFDAIALDGLIRGIAEQPTIDAEPVRHAKVLYNVAIEKEECIGYKKRKGLVLQKYTCSSCYTAIDGDDKFCKECGAKLNLEE